MDQNISHNSLSLLDNISGWCYLLMNTNTKLNLQQRFSNNLSTSLDQSNIYIINIIAVQSLLFC